MDFHDEHSQLDHIHISLFGLAPNRVMYTIVGVKQMSAIAPIIINDGQATPVAHTFNPTEAVPPTYRENGNSAVPAIGQAEIMASLRMAQGGNGINKAVITLKVPVLETISGSTVGGMTPAPEVAYYMTFKGEVLLPNRSTGAQRKDLRVLMKNLLDNAQIISLIDTLERPY